MKLGVRRCLGVMQRTCSLLDRVCLHILVCLPLLRLELTSVVGTLCDCRRCIRLCTSVSNGAMMRANALGSVVGSRQYMDPLLLAGTMVTMLWFETIVLMVLLRLGWNELNLKQCPNVVSTQLLSLVTLSSSCINNRYF